MIIATAGHVDHGKTSLIKALTGTDTDRLPEEKKRGLTIELGFAYDHLGGGGVLGFVDVPGHERFTSNMLAGIAAIDFALVIIAADDGPMPQTLEHLAALDLMDITCGAVALTKCDRVSEERIEEVLAEIVEILRVLSLSGVPVFPLSSTTGEGVPALRTHLESEARALPVRSMAGNFRFAVDRRFTVDGAGLVVTGTVHAGAVSTGDTIIVSPGGEQARVRSIHQENRASETSSAGHRCALNLVGPDVSEESVSRGDWIVAPEVHAPTRRFDARLAVLASEEKPLRHWTPVHVHMGAVHLTGRVAVLGSEKVILPGTEGDVQIVLDTPTSAMWGDRFVIRDQSATRTLGGGSVLDAFAPGRDRTKPWRALDREAHGMENVSDALCALAGHHGEGYAARPFFTGRNLTPDETRAAIAAARDRLAFTGMGDDLFTVNKERWAQLRGDVLSGLARFHESYGEVQGCTPGNLKNLVSTRVLAPLLEGLVRELRAEGKVDFTGQVLHLPEHEARLSAEDEAFAVSLVPLLTRDPLCPPVVHDLAKSLEMEPAALVRKLDHLAAMGRLIAMDQQRYFLTGQNQELAAHATALHEACGSEGFTASQFKDAAAIGRRPAVQILEYFDAVGLTRREGNLRRVIRKPEDVFGDTVAD